MYRFLLNTSRYPPAISVGPLPASKGFTYLSHHH
jgi:hypothetical protein